MPLSTFNFFLLAEKRKMDKSFIQLAKPLLAERELDLLLESNGELQRDLRAHRGRTNEAQSLLLALLRTLKLPVRVLQQTCYAYQRFYLFNGNYKKYSTSQIDVSLAALFTALKANDFIVKLTNVLQEANSIRKINVDIEDQKKVILSFERKIMEFQSFDFRSPIIEELLIRFLKFYSTELDNQILYISWSVLNDLYFTKLVLMYPAHLNALVTIQCAILIHNELQGEDLKVDFKKLKFDVDQKELNNGCNIMMEHYIDSTTGSSTFLTDTLMELNYPIQNQSPSQTPTSTPKKLQDSLINIKIILNNNLPKQMENIKEALKDDEFFRPRDGELSKNGSIRFLYNRQKYTNEVLYKKP